MPSCFLVISWTKKRHGEWQATGPACWKLSLTWTVYIIYSPHLFLPAEYQHVEGVVKTSESVCWPNSRAKKWPKNQLKSHIFCVWKDYTIIRKQQWTLLINPHGGIIHRGISIFSHWQDVNTQCLSWENKGWKKLTAASGSQDFFARNEFRVSLWVFFFNENRRFQVCIFFLPYFITNKSFKLKQKHAGRKEGSVGMPSAQCC